MTKRVSADQAFQARVSLDARLGVMKSAVAALAKPRGGWIHAIRLGLGMSATDLATRLNVTPSTIQRLEANEVAGTINLASLKRVADELDCDLIYALVPRQELGIIVKKRALSLARGKLTRAQKTMSLENQTLKIDVLNRLIAQKANELEMSPRLWKENVTDVN